MVYRIQIDSPSAGWLTLASRPYLRQALLLAAGRRASAQFPIRVVDIHDNVMTHLDLETTA